MRRGPALACAVAASLAWAGCASQAAPEVGLPDDEIAVSRERFDRGEAKVVEVHRQEVPQAVAAAGRVAFDDQRVQHVFSPVAGQVTRVLAQPGDRVRPGTPLVALSSPDAGSALADVVKARADLGQAIQDLQRQERLLAAGAAPRRDLEAAQDAHARAQAELDRARQRAALLRSADLDAVSQEVTLKSAIAGEVMARTVSPGMQLQGAGGTPVEIFTLGDIGRVWVLAEVPEQDLPRVKLGAAATVRVAAWPDRELHGSVEAIGGSLDPVLRTARVRLVLTNEDRALRPEMLAAASIAAEARMAIVVPRKALVQIEGETFAYLPAGEDATGFRFRRRRVEASGESSQPLALVERGLAEGERVLVEGEPREAEAGEVRVTPRQFERSGMRVEPARARELPGALTASARVAFDDARVAHVFSPVNGRVTRVLVRPGQQVKKGAPLAAILSPDVGSAFADAVKAQADEVAARHELDRQQELFALHASARKDLEAADASWRKARAELERARQKTSLLSRAGFDAVTQELTLRSPVEGEVINRAAAPGLEVQGQWNGAATPVELFSVGALDPLWVMGDVYETDLSSVRAGQQVTARLQGFPDRAFRGRVDWVSGTLDPATHTAKVRCAIDNPDRALRPEMAPVLTIALPAQRRVTVPRDALLRLGDDAVVFVATGTRPDGQLSFQRRTVVAGEDRPDGTVPLQDGVVEGEQVVVSGAIFLVGLL